MIKHNKLYASLVVVAAGKGTRMNMDMNKQYIKVGGTPILARTLRKFDDLDYINEIILVVHCDDILYCKDNIIDAYKFKKIKCVVTGGLTRQDSVFNGLKEVCDEADVVIIHDGARPFVDEGSIIGCIEAAIACGVATVAVPVKDTIKSSNSEGFVDSTPDRSTLWAVQTPQAFKYNIIMDSHKCAKKDNFVGTDDTVLAERLGFKTKLVMGNYNNIKITTKEDLIFAEAIINAEEEL
ncbi:2-C-methyl-D-erythritol 4-phosphate cytidylyltransferase [Acetivibrio cellulolyticus]|uniref:2-C-methyl-D-erythritol 4-phosphate cytidylyltransferase n=1 Tax=Acetivibrio cellulolyticus TaxID=35830 RepID=UPI0001E2E255|nr:2-C-methyl-D-erythritol 4-phosphate cytidylyltransferase [Acetivibrio cellulolyticus]